MIKFAGKLDGRPLYGLGLSRENYRLLLEGHPILVKLEQMGGHGTILIVGGENEQDMVDDLRRAGMIGPDVEINNQEDLHQQDV